VVIVDYNRLQGCGYAENILPMGKIADKFKAFNFQVVEIDGHDHLAISNAISQSSGPLCIVAHTIKGKGISFMENNNLWHYKNLDNDTYCQALKELEYLDA
jgi:transketolase